MKFKKSLFAAAAALTLMVTLLPVSQAEAATLFAFMAPRITPSITHTGRRRTMSLLPGSVR
jgi:hypothetical protein